MDKLDKEELAKEYANDSEEGGLSRYDYKEGLEYAENHYLKVIETLKNVCLEQDKNALKSIENNLNSLELLYKREKELQRAKELLKQVVLHLEDGIGNDGIKGMIEEFLKK